MPIILLLIGALLIIVNIKATIKSDKSFKNVLQYNKKDMSEASVAVGQIRKDIAESLTEIQQDILEIKDRLAKLENSDNEANIIKDSKNKDELLNLEELVTKDEAVINEINNKSKTDKIIELIKEGYSDADICNKLSVGKGEILLVKGLLQVEKNN